MSIYLAPLIAIAGALAYCFAGHLKIQELGRIAFAMALLAWLLVVAGGKVFHF